MVLSIIFLEDKHKIYNIIKKKLIERAIVGHGSLSSMCSHVTCLIGNWAAVSRNRYRIEKTVDTHKEIRFQSIDRETNSKEIALSLFFFILMLTAYKREEIT
jgi:hypothetical protein